MGPNVMWGGAHSRHWLPRMEVLQEMTIGRTEDPVNPVGSMAFEAAGLFGTGSREPSGPADMMPRLKAGHMDAIDHLVGILIFGACIQRAVHT